jgi:hypothetical protein
MKLPKTPFKKELDEYTKTELISLITVYEEQFNTKNERLKDTSSKLTRARIRLQLQNQRLQHMRKRIVALTTPL